MSVLSLMVSLLLIAPNSAHSQDFHAQGTIQYQYFKPALKSAADLPPASTFSQLAVFEIDVSNSVFYMKVAPANSPGILFHEVGTDGSNTFAQTVYNPDRQRRLMATRADGSFKEMVQPGPAKSANDASANVRPSNVPRNRGFHEGAIWFALASHLAYPHTNGQIVVHPLWESGDNDYQSFTSRLNAVVIPLAGPPSLPAQADFLSEYRITPGKIDYDEDFHYTNTTYRVLDILTVEGLNFPRKFMLNYYQAVRDEDGRPGTVLVAAHSGEVTNAGVGTLKKNHVPELALRTYMTDFRVFRRSSNSLPTPVSGFFQQWGEAATTPGVISFDAAFSQHIPETTAHHSPAGSGRVARFLTLGCMILTVAAFTWWSLALRRRHVHSNDSVK